MLGSGRYRTTGPVPRRPATTAARPSPAAATAATAAAGATAEAGAGAAAAAAARVEAGAGARVAPAATTATTAAAATTAPASERDTRRSADTFYCALVGSGSLPGSPQSGARLYSPWPHTPWLRDHYPSPNTEPEIEEEKLHITMILAVAVHYLHVNKVLNENGSPRIGIILFG